MELLRYLAGPGDRCWTPCRREGRKVAGEVGMLRGVLGALSGLGHGESFVMLTLEKRGRGDAFT